MTDFGKYLHKLRQLKGGSGHWSLRAVSNRAKISHAYLSELENNKATRPSPEVLHRIADVFDVPINDIMVQAGYLEDKELARQDNVIASIRYQSIQTTTCNNADQLIEIPKIEQETITFSKNMITSQHTFAVKINSDCFCDVGLRNGDVAIVSTSDKIKSGDLAIVQYGDRIFIKKVFFQQTNVVLSSIGGRDEPIVTKSKAVGMLGKITNAIKTF